MSNATDKYPNAALALEAMRSCFKFHPEFAEQWVVMLTKDIRLVNKRLIDSDVEAIARQIMKSKFGYDQGTSLKE